MSIWTILALGIGPGIFWLIYFYSKDKLEPEPRHMVVASFVIGAIAAIPIAMTEWAISEVLFAGLFVMAVFVAPVVEEIGKYLAIRSTVFKSPHFDEPMDGIVYGVAGALGFASVENVMYLIATSFDPTVFWSTAGIRAFLSVPGHALFSAMWGYALGWSKFTQDPAKRNLLLLSGLSLAIMFHGLFNFSVTSGAFLGYSGLVLIIILLYITWKTVLQKIDHALKHSPHAEKGPNNPASQSPQEPQNRLRL